MEHVAFASVVTNLSTPVSRWFFSLCAIVLGRPVAIILPNFDEFYWIQQFYIHLARALVFQNSTMEMYAA